VVFHDTADDCKADSGSVRSSREVVLENALFLILGNSWTLVVDGKNDFARSHVETNGHLGPCGSRLDGISHEVPDNLPDLRAIASRAHVPARTLVDDAYVGAARRVCRQLDDVTRETGNVGGLHRGRSGLREIDHVAHEIVEPSRLAFDDVAEAAVFGRERARLAKHFDGPRDGPEGVANLVSEPRCDSTQDREPLRLVGSPGGGLKRSTREPQALREVPREQRDDRDAQRIEQDGKDELRGLRGIAYSALILPAMLKIGRYMAMSTTPTCRRCRPS
jgi:hypothetical protein